MKLGNWFDATQEAPPQPVNPKPITLTLVCEGDTLPNGQPNPGGRPIKKTGPAALVMLGGKAVLESRVRARQLLATLVEPMREGNEPPPRTNEGDENIATMYEQLARVVREWDPQAQVLGPPLFPSAEIALQFVTFDEANRITREYNAYMTDEHPTEVAAATRNKSAGRAARPSAGPPR